MPTVTQVNDLKINKLTKAQYDAAVQAGVIGENEISIITDLDDGQVIQVATLPTASADELDNIYQFIGTTDANYTNGYFYKCVSDGADPATYSWEAVEVQASSGGLPDQTGNAGKFLTTDGTDASWSDKPLVNVSTQNGSLVVGSGSQSLVVDTTAYGVNTIGFGRYASAFGKSAVAKYKATALGANSTANEYTIQLGQGGTNSDAGTMKVALTTSSDVTTNYELLSADGTVPTARLTKVNTTITLTAAGWSNSSQTVNVTGMTADGVVFVNPTPANQSAYTSAGILCTAQAAGSLTFTCDTVPSADITVTVVML